MEIWGMNVQTLWTIFIVLGVVLTIWGMRLIVKILKRDTSKAGGEVPAVVLGVSCTISSLFVCGFLRSELSNSPLDTSIISFLVRFAAFLLALGLILLAIGSKILRGKDESEDSPHTTINSLKELQKKQKEEVERLKTR